MDASRLLGLLLRGRRDSPPELGDPALEGALSAAVAVARGAYPDLRIEDERFLPYLGERLDAASPLLEALQRVHAADVYLACGCASSDPVALRMLENRHLTVVGPAVRHIDASETFADEVRQILRERLLVAPAGEAPRIAQFDGRASLSTWLRLIAVRTALTLVREARREVADPEERLLEMPEPGPDPEIEHLKGKYREELREAVREAFAALDEKEQNLLRQHFVHGLSIDQIGGIQGVHRATAARWLVKARKRMSVETRRCLTRRLGIDRFEVDSVVRLLRSRLDITLRDLVEGR